MALEFLKVNNGQICSVLHICPLAEHYLCPLHNNNGRAEFILQIGAAL